MINEQGRSQSLVSKQKGVVLVVSLVFLIALTAVAAALMQNTTTDFKMSGASEEKVVATQEAISAIDEIIFKQTLPNAINYFTAAPTTFNGESQNLINDLSITNKNDQFSSATIDMVMNKYNLTVGCPTAKIASSFGRCNVLRVQVSRKYGRNNTSEITVSSGIVQRLIDE